ncbi:hypothetical protein [Sphingomonas beigongshangi]|jgi:hypothetical protein|uniref:hypothetical protein n=1 Tax=Sphingomonas beigongshangi TaxID=2782540 RepID=UPI001AEE29E0|nr:hypothetical protein [Sphingomonas beigongshangi]
MMMAPRRMGGRHAPQEGEGEAMRHLRVADIVYSKRLRAVSLRCGLDAVPFCILSMVQANTPFGGLLSGADAAQRAIYLA